MALTKGPEVETVRGIPLVGVHTDGLTHQKSVLLGCLADHRMPEPHVWEVLTLILLSSCFLLQFCLTLVSAFLLTSQAIMMPINHADITVF